jgi:hypothetical protein
MDNNKAVSAAAQTKRVAAVIIPKTLPNIKLTQVHKIPTAKVIISKQSINLKAFLISLIPKENDIIMRKFEVNIIYSIWSKSIYYKHWA